MIRFLKNLFVNKAAEPQHPEHAFRVWDSGEFVHCACENQSEQSMRWDDIESVSIITNDEGPLLPDVFWCLEGESAEIIFPQMALGGQQKDVRVSKKTSGLDP